MDMPRTLAHLFGISVICIMVSTYTIYAPGLFRSAEWRSAAGPFPNDVPDSLFWIVQVSDIHISRFYDPQRGPEFQDFCTKTLKIINPDVVLVTGDLTDAKSRDKYDSMQYQDEWETYHKIIEESKVMERFVWLDIRGNHDAFDVLKFNDSNSNPYLKYSGDKGKLSSKVYHLQKPFGKYSFIPVDATMIPGPRRPYNFAGYLPENRMALLKQFNEMSRNSNFSVWYSHFPTCSVTPNSDLQSLVAEKGGIYVAGHLHTIGGLSHSLYAMNSKGFLELELADWKDARTFRVIAFDHDLVSFSDFKYNEWPAVVITNPKEARYMMPNAEPVDRIGKSSHIRFLIFNPWKIVEVVVTIDGITLPDNPYQVESSSLWVCRWDTSLYRDGTHDISISVRDTKGNTRSVIQQFSLDRSWHLDFGYFASFVILTDFSTLLFYVFYLLSLGYISAIAFFRFYQFNETTHFSILMKLSKLMRDDVVFNGLFGFALNFMLGPWFVGSLIRGTFGICFSYGIWIEGVMQPEDITLFRDGIIMIFTFYAPAMIFLSIFNYAQSSKAENELQKMVSWPPKPVLLAYTIYIAIHFYFIWGLHAAYGLIAAILSPFKLWWTCFVIYATLRIYCKKPPHSQ